MRGCRRPRAAQERKTVCLLMLLLPLPLLLGSCVARAVQLVLGLDLCLLLGDGSLGGGACLGHGENDTSGCPEEDEEEEGGRRTGRLLQVPLMVVGSTG